MQYYKYIIGSVSFVLLIIGMILKRLHYPGQQIFVFSGLILFLIGFTITLFNTLIGQSRRALKRSTIILFVAIEFSIMGLVASQFYLPGSYVFEGLALMLFGIYWIFYSDVTEGRKIRLRKDRQLAAILFTDIVGFTGIMGENEDEALTIIEKNRKIQKKAIRKYRGKWLKEMGDGSLVIFYTATEAVSAAVEIQRIVQAAGDFELRMGVHISEILFSDTDVFGDGVNVASRIADLASANEICISETVFHNIRNREKILITPMGNPKLKNVLYPINIYKIEISKSDQQV